MKPDTGPPVSGFFMPDGVVVKCGEYIVALRAGRNIHFVDLDFAQHPRNKWKSRCLEESGLEAFQG
jgi:hypothetical protein